MSLTQQAFSGILWTAAERFGLQLIQFVVVIVLARLLTPEDFGLVAMLMVIFAVSSVLVNGGFTAALIREPEITEEDKSTAFWMNLIAAVVLYGVIWVAAPAVAAFFEQPELVDLTRFMALNLIFLALTLVQQADLTHRLSFKRLGLVSLAAAVVTGAVAVTLAYMGIGCVGAGGEVRPDGGVYLALPVDRQSLGSEAGDQPPIRAVSCSGSVEARCLWPARSGLPERI